MTDNRRNTRLTAEQVYSMRERWAARTVTQVELALEYQVSINTIRNALKGLTWQSVRQVTGSEELEHQIAESQRRLAMLLEGADDDTALLAKLAPTLEPASVSDNSSDLASLVEGLRKRKAELASDEPSDPPVGGAVPQVDIEETRTDDNDQD